MSNDLAEHLKYFSEIGVSGVSRDPAWRKRTDPASASPAVSEAGCYASADASGWVRRSLHRRRWLRHGEEVRQQMASGGLGVGTAVGTWREDLPFWWRVARPFSLTASAIPVFVGGALAVLAGRFDWLNFGLLLIPCLLIQVATNGFNEYYDYRRGLDTHESVGIAGVIVGGHLTEKSVLRFALGCLALALPFCLVLVVRTGWPVLLIGVASAFAA